MSRKIVLTSRTWSLASAQLQRLSDAGFTLVERQEIGCSASETAIADGLHGAWAVIAGGERYSRRVIEAADSLRVIGRPGAGYDAIDLEAASDAGIVVFTTPGANRNSVADFAIAMMLAVLRRIVALDAEVRSGQWRAGDPGRDLYGAAVGIVGLGAVGQAVARRLTGFGCRIVGSDPVIDAGTAAAAGVELLPLAATLAESEIVTLHTALTAETEGLIGRAELKAMRRDAILVNTSRGSVVRQDALVEALATGEIAAAALDVFEREPLPADDPLIGLPNVVLSSHVASHTRQSIDAMVGSVVDGILELAAGRAPAGALNPDVLESGFELQPPPEGTGR